ncbi:VTT domain-containing protein [Luteimonas sp. e5]
MTSAWLDQLVAWIGEHPAAAIAFAFLVALCDALAVVGILVPALPLLFAVGALIGLGHVNGPLAVAAAASGAFIGDAVSYWIGQRWGPQMRGLWLFRRYPQLIDRSERLFRRHGLKSILIARYVGAVRPFVPAIAGMLHMPFARYAAASALACASWALLFLAPGWLFGKSYDAVAAVADKLALVLVALAAVVAAAWAGVIYTSRWFADHADGLLARSLRWSRAHPRIGRLAAYFVDPRRPDSPSLLLLIGGLIAMLWAAIAGALALAASGGPLAIDHRVYQAMFALRNPLADNLMAALARLGDAEVLGPAVLAGVLWLLWRRRWAAALHWLAALMIGWLAAMAVKHAVHMPRPPVAPAGFGFPSVSIVMMTIGFGFFAVLIAREWPGRRRIWPYLAGTVAVCLVAFARLYLGAHWLSDVVSAMLFGLLWVFALGIAYRRRVERSFWMRPLAAIFYTVFIAAALWHGPRGSEALLAKFSPPPTRVMSLQHWRGDGWRELPGTRNARGDTIRWPLDLQVAGPLVPVQTALEVAGWRVKPQAEWVDMLGLLDGDAVAARLPILPSSLEGHPEALLMSRPGADEHEREVLRLWPAPARMEDGTELWIGTVQTMRLRRVLGVARLWLPVDDGGAAYASLRQDLATLPRQADGRRSDGVPVLRIDTTRVP